MTIVSSTHIVRCFCFLPIYRGGSTWRPHVQLTGNVPQPNASHLQTVTKTSLAHQQQDVKHIGSGYNNSARPFVSITYLCPPPRKWDLYNFIHMTKHEERERERKVSRKNVPNNNQNNKKNHIKLCKRASMRV